MFDVAACLKSSYAIEVALLTLLPVGADLNASVYRANGSDQRSYFVKVTRGRPSLKCTALLQKSNIPHVVYPVKTLDGELFQRTGDLAVIVYPYIEGKDGFVTSLSNEQWVELGRTLRGVHTMEVPAALGVACEKFLSKWRQVVRSIYEKEPQIRDAIGSELWQFLQEKREQILQIVERSDELSEKVRQRSYANVLCHSDIHAGNVLITSGGEFYIVDWDHPILAPKERDLMFFGGGVGNVWNQPDEVKQFYQGYGAVDIDRTLLSYYRFERIVEDIAEYYCELLLHPIEGRDRLGMYRQFTAMFAPNGVVDIAFASEHRE
ncbi:MAG: aminoglycoside phosphotransferase family protein [Chlamydiales bacterium]|nr:aminoglycoside phosphotransferase family protein [Chlamydiales bacterium]